MRKGIVEKAVAKAAYKAARSSANRVCAILFYQPKVPKELKKLRRF